MRSIPSECISSILVGMKSEKSIQENLEVIYRAPLEPSPWWDYLKGIDTSETQRKILEAEENIIKQIQQEEDERKSKLKNNGLDQN